MLSYKYTITKIDTPFEFLNGSKVDTTILVTFVDDDGDEIKSKRYGFVTPESVYELIDNNQSINLDEAYIKNFSLHDYRHSRRMDDRAYVNFNTFSAQNAFFDCENRVDFAFAKFTKSFNLKHTVFAKGYINFYKSVFLKEVDFSEVNFGKGEADFHFSEFGNYDTNFKNAIFPSGNISFVNCDFGNGTIDFSSVNFGEGNADFHFSKFGKGLVNFDKSIFGGG